VRKEKQSQQAGGAKNGEVPRRGGARAGGEHREDGEGGTEKDDSEEDKGEAQEGGRS